MPWTYYFDPNCCPDVYDPQIWPYAGVPVGSGGGITSPPPGYGTVGGTLSVDVVGRLPTETFGPIASRSNRETYNQQRRFMPFNFGAIAGRFLPGQQTNIYDRAADLAARVAAEALARRGMLPAQTGGAIQTMPGRVITSGSCECQIQKQMPAYVRKMKGRPVFDANGQVVGCTPTRRRMNPMNARAATRAARRLRGTMKFMKRIEKAVQRACRSKRSGGFRTTRKRTCK